MMVIGKRIFCREMEVIIAVIITLGMISTLLPIGYAKEIRESNSRGVDGWTDIAEEKGSFFLDTSHDMIISYDEGEDTVIFGESYDPYYDLEGPIRKAVDRAPQWLNDTLVWSFLNIYSQYRMKFAEILLNESIDSRYMDEIAFTLAYMPSTFLNYYRIEGKFLWENADIMYTVSDDVRYAEISDYNLSDGQHSTITYKVPSGNVTMPEKIYYYYVVMPKIGSDNLEYMDPETGEFAFSYDGGEFWRTWLYNNNHTGFPLLKDYLASEDYLWNGTMNQIEKNGAVGALTKWEMESMMFGMPVVRQINPIFIYRNHMGMCGENAYILASVAKIALIPTVITVTWEGNHEWNDFWERGWHQWEGYSGQIDNPSCEGAPGTITAFTSVNPDFSHFSLTGCYTTTSNLTVKVSDQDGIPVDGVLVKLHSYPAINVDGSLGLISNLTDVNGETTFEIGTGFSYFVNYRAPIGGPPDQNAQAVFACTTTVPGADYIFNLTLPGKMPLKVNYSDTKEMTYGLRFNISAEEIDHLTNFYEDDMDFNVRIWKGYEDITRLSVHFLDDNNLQLYRQGKKFFTSGVVNLTEDKEGSIILEDKKWNILIAGKSAPLTRTYASLNINVSRSLVTPESLIISPINGSLFKVEEWVTFEGDIDFLMGSNQGYSFRWFDRLSSSILSEKRSFSMQFDVGTHVIDFEIWKDGIMISTSVVEFKVYQPNRPPIAVIASPSNNDVFTYGTKVEFSAEGSYDPDEDGISYRWSELGINITISNQKEFSSKFDVGVHFIELLVTDDEGDSTKEQVKFRILEPTFPPVPTIRSPISNWKTYEDEWIELNASGTYDLDGDVLKYTWISSIDDVISKSKIDSVHLSVGNHIIELQVSDGMYTESKFVNVTVMEREVEIQDSEPVSLIISPYVMVEYFVSDLIEFNASASYDPDGNTNLTFEWRLNGEPISSEKVFFKYLTEGSHQIQLSVFSGDLVSNSSQIITVIDRIPIMKIRVNETIWIDSEIIKITSFENITFDASGCRDPDGSELSYDWSINGTSISNNIEFVHSFEPGMFLVHLTIRDGGGKVNSFSLYINSSKIIESKMDEPVVNDEGSNGKGTLHQLFVIIPIVILLIIMGLLIFLVIWYRKNREENITN